HASVSGVCSPARTSTRPPLKSSNLYVWATWRFNDALLNWVRTKMRLIPELMQLLIGTSTRRYLPASGTAGLLRYVVSGASRVPRPPPSTTAIISDHLSLLTKPYSLPGSPGRVAQLHEPLHRYCSGATAAMLPRPAVRGEDHP